MEKTIRVERKFTDEERAELCRSLLPPSTATIMVISILVLAE